MHTYQGNGCLKAASAQSQLLTAYCGGQSSPHTLVSHFLLQVEIKAPYTAGMLVPVVYGANKIGLQMSLFSAPCFNRQVFRFMYLLQCL